MSQQYGLGRGLASLIPPKKSTEELNDQPIQSVPFVSPVPNQAVTPFPALEHPAVIDGKAIIEVSVGKIIPNPQQPRLHFDESKLTELADSIKEHGILQPLIVTRQGTDYELIAGERRLQAAKRAGLSTVPVIVRAASDLEKLELAIIENVQRHDLDPIEEAKSYVKLMEDFGLHQDDVAVKMGKSRSSVANIVRLLRLPVEIQRAIADGRISEGHAKALLAIENPEKQRAVFDLIIKEELTVRETEAQVRNVAVKSHVRSAIAIHPDIVSHAEHLSQVLGTKVKIAPSGKGGRVVIEYYSSEDLDNIFKRLEE